MTEAPMSNAAIRWREELGKITRAKGPREALDAAATWLAAMEDKLRNPSKSSNGSKNPGRKPGVPIAGKLTKREGEALSHFLAGLSLEDIGRQMGVTGQAIGQLVKRKGWTR